MQGDKHSPPLSSELVEQWTQLMKQAQHAMLGVLADTLNTAPAKPPKTDNFTAHTPDIAEAEAEAEVGAGIKTKVDDTTTSANEMREANANSAQGNSGSNQNDSANQKQDDAQKLHDAFQALHAGPFAKLLNNSIISDWTSLASASGQLGNKLIDRHARLTMQSIDLWSKIFHPHTKRAQKPHAENAAANAHPVASAQPNFETSAPDNETDNSPHAFNDDARDRLFTNPKLVTEEWQNSPLFDAIRQSHQLIATHLLESLDELPGIADKRREQMRFSTQLLIDALNPDNYPFSNPQIITRTLETGGQNLATGIDYFFHDLAQGQIKHTATEGFEIGRNIAATPGKVVFENALFQLIHYQPTTAVVGTTPLLIFPPWINRFYILDLNPAKSFVQWAVAQGISTFIVSWKSADETMKSVSADDYVIDGQVKAIETVCTITGEEATNVIGYCVAGTTLAMTLSWLASQGKAERVKSATFFTAQVDFEDAGDLSHFVSDDQLSIIKSLTEEKGYLDGRYMAAIFNLLRGRELIWNYVINNYFMGDDYTPFDLLYWNSDVTNLPARWHLDYLAALYRDNSLVKGDISIAGQAIDLGSIQTPAYIQAGRDDHIAPPHSVWKMTQHLKGDLRFILAGSGHIAGVINPPSSNKYQYWTNDTQSPSYDAFLHTAVEHKGSWWPDWFQWLKPHLGADIPAIGTRIPGQHPEYPAIENAPGRYVKMR